MLQITLLRCILQDRRGRAHRLQRQIARSDYDIEQSPHCSSRKGSQECIGQGLAEYPARPLGAECCECGYYRKNYGRYGKQLEQPGIDRCDYIHYLIQHLNTQNSKDGTQHECSYPNDYLLHLQFNR